MELYINNKNRKMYVKFGHATNGQEDKNMVIYCSVEDNECYVREASEFDRKFTFLEKDKNGF